MASTGDLRLNQPGIGIQGLYEQEHELSKDQIRLTTDQQQHLPQQRQLRAPFYHRLKQVLKHLCKALCLKCLVLLVSERDELEAVAAALLNAVVG